MPGPCHHCGTEVDDGAADGQDGRCSTCNTVSRFCLVCGWWELGPPDNLAVDMANVATAALTAASDVITPCAYPNPLVTAVTSQCSMIEKQLTTKASYAAGAYSIQYWNGTIQTLHEAVTKAVNWLKGFLPEDAADPYGRRMRAMTIVYLAAYQQCFEHQTQRVVGGNPFASASLHDASTIAAKHFALHNGFGIDDDLLADDVAALRHVDTIEQFLKGTMKPAIVAWRIRHDIPDLERAGSAAARAFLIYLALLTVARPWSQQTKPDAGFSPTSPDNLAAGIFRQAEDITALIPDVTSRATSMLAKTRLKALYDALIALPDFPGGRLFRFNTPESDDRLDQGTLSAAQKLYLQSLQDLDDGRCPSACQQILYNATAANITRIVRGFAATEEFVDLCRGLGKFFDGVRYLLDPEMVGVMVTNFLQRSRSGRLALQTCAVDASWIIDKRYVGIHAVYADRGTFGALLFSCAEGKNCGDAFVGSTYGKAEIARATDDRRLSPLNYSHWRIQKDRAAHKFLPLAYEDYDVTAALSQSYPLPEPDPTYGTQMLVWKPDLWRFCTFKIGDSGKPTRSFLALLHMLSETALVDFNSRVALFNLLLPVFNGNDEEPAALFADAMRRKWLYQTKRPGRFVDIEAHLYGDIRLDAVEVVVLPKSGARNANRFHVPLVVVYDDVAFAERAQDLDKGNSGLAWMTAAARAQPQ
ncbi:MAG: zinc ribbon domain-containing protein [Acidobacteria bacterium]|nr:zinc ribbon domain-containing protein [Acidobacteriota bacterium]